MVNNLSRGGCVWDLFDDEVFGFVEGEPGPGFFWNEGLPCDALEVRGAGVGDLDGVEEGGFAGDGEFVVAQILKSSGGFWAFQIVQVVDGEALAIRVD
jgi:hypothetical protein